MSEAEFSFLPLRVLRVGVGGKRTFEPEGNVSDRRIGSTR